MTNLRHRIEVLRDVWAGANQSSTGATLRGVAEELTKALDLADGDPAVARPVVGALALADSRGDSRGNAEAPAINEAVRILGKHRLMSNRNGGYYRTYWLCMCGEEVMCGNHDEDPNLVKSWDDHLARALADAGLLGCGADGVTETHVLTEELDELRRVVDNRPISCEGAPKTDEEA